VTPEFDRVYHQYRELEKGYREVAQPNRVTNGCRDVTPKITREQEK